MIGIACKINQKKKSPAKKRKEKFIGTVPKVELVLVKKTLKFDFRTYWARYVYISPYANESNKKKKYQPIWRDTRNSLARQLWKM